MRDVIDPRRPRQYCAAGSSGFFSYGVLVFDEKRDDVRIDLGHNKVIDIKHFSESGHGYIIIN